MEVVLQNRTTQKVFTSEDNHDIGDSSQNMFEEDNFDVQKNDNLLVKSDQQTQRVRGTEAILINLFNFDFTDFEFGANKMIQIKVAFINFIKEPFWIALQYLCLVPFIGLIYKVTNSIIQHHKDVKNSIQEPPSRCLTL